MSRSQNNNISSCSSSKLSVVVSAVVVLVACQSLLISGFPAIETRSFQSYGPNGGDGGMKGEKGYQLLHKVLGDLALASRPRYGKRSVNSRYWIPRPAAASSEDDLLNRMTMSELESLLMAAIASSSAAAQSDTGLLEKRMTEKV